MLETVVVLNSTKTQDSISFLLQSEYSQHFMVIKGVLKLRAEIVLSLFSEEIASNGKYQTLSLQQTVRSLSVTIIKR
jgi:hypothetical protein